MVGVLLQSIVKYMVPLSLYKDLRSVFLQKSQKYSSPAAFFEAASLEMVRLAWVVFGLIQ